MMKAISQIELELELLNYWEHKKYAIDLQRALPLDHPKRVQVENALRELEIKLNLDK